MKLKRKESNLLKFIAEILELNTTTSDKKQKGI